MNFEKVSIAPCPDYAPENVRKALIAALDSIGGLDAVPGGMKVAIKANLVTLLRPERAATTHPIMLAELTRLLTERGAKVVVGDSPGGPYNAMYLKSVYAATGLEEVKAAGGQLNDNFAESQADFPEAKQAKTFSYTSWLDDADIIINFAKLKTHGMMGMSAAVKNMFGAIPGTVKPEYHYRFPDGRDFADMLIDLNEYFKPALHIIDGVVGMEGNGPTGGTPREIGCVLAGKNPYTLDLVAAKIIGFELSGVPTLAAAFERGYAPERAEEVPLALESIERFAVDDYKLMEKLNSIEFLNKFAFSSKTLGRMLSGMFASVPRVTKSECVGCRKCEEICPAKAIVMRDKKPVIDRKKCIRCFCCQEFCPPAAMKHHRPLAARILNKM